MSFARPSERVTPHHTANQWGSKRARSSPNLPSSAETFAFLGWRTAHAEWMAPSHLFDDLARADLVCLAVDTYDAVTEATVRLLLEEAGARASQSGRLQHLALALPPLESPIPPTADRRRGAGNPWARELLRLSVLSEAELPYLLEIVAQAREYGIPVAPVGNPRVFVGTDTKPHRLNRPSVFPERILELFAKESPAPQLLLLAPHRDCSNEGWLTWLAAGSSLVPRSIGLDRAGPLDPERPLPPSRIDPYMDYQIVIMPGS